MRNNQELFAKLVILLALTITSLTGYVVRCHAGESGSISGTWVANGTREELPFGENRSTALVKLSGHVNLGEPLAGRRDYWSECIGLADSLTGSDVRCVWRSLDGQEVFLLLKADRLSEGSGVTGTFVGGTEDAAGISGSISFQWSTMTFETTNKVTTVGGYAKNMKGTYRLP